MATKNNIALPGYELVLTARGLENATTDDFVQALRRAADAIEDTGTAAVLVNYRNERRIVVALSFFSVEGG